MIIKGLCPFQVGCQNSFNNIQVGFIIDTCRCVDLDFSVKGVMKMKVLIKASGLLLGLLLLTELCIAASFVREANFYRVFDGQNYYSGGVDFNIELSAMSSNGKVVAFYGKTYVDGAYYWKMFIHNFESTSEPVEVFLPSSVGYFATGPGLAINADGSRIFFIAKDTTAYRYIFCMVNGSTGELTPLLYTTNSGENPVEKPYEIATDANGDYLYFNESDTGDRGNLWRIQTHGGAVPELVIDAGSVGHPSGGVVRFIAQFDVSDDGSTIAFFGEGRIKSDGTAIRTDKELFVKTAPDIKFLTNNEQNGKYDLVISGDGSTIVYSGSPTSSWEWMVTTPDAAVEGQIPIEPGYRNCGDRPGISTDGSLFFGRSTLTGTSSCYGYLINTDGSGRRMVEPDQISFRGTADGLHLSGDGTRIFFKNRSYVYSDEWYNMTAGIFDRSLWTTEVPAITSVTYPIDLFVTLENNERFDINIGVNDPQEAATIDNVDKTELFANGYKAHSAGPIAISPSIKAADGRYDLYTTQGYRGTSWPEKEPLTVRFSVEDQNGNISYADTELTIDDFTIDQITHTSPSGTTEDTTPVFSWIADPAATWYKLWVGYSGDQKIFAQWYDAADICSGDSCSVTTETEFNAGNYEWYIKSWNDYGNVWSDGMAFTVQGTPPSKATHTSPSGPLESSTSTFAWVADPVSTWYRLWVGYPGDQKIFAKWYDAADICSDGNCSIIIGEEFNVGNYEWYIKSWNDFGKVWSDGMNFTVGE